jgi:hypothetical protein
VLTQALAVILGIYGQETEIHGGEGHISLEVIVFVGIR